MILIETNWLQKLQNSKCQHAKYWWFTHRTPPTEKLKLEIKTRSRGERVRKWRETMSKTTDVMSLSLFWPPPRHEERENKYTVILHCTATYLVSSMLGYFSGMEIAELTSKCNKRKIIHLHETCFFLLRLSPPLYTVIVIALFLHILWAAGSTPTHTFVLQDNACYVWHENKTNNCNGASLYPTQVSEPPSTSMWRSCDTHSTAFGTSDMQLVYVCVSIMK